MFLNTELMQKIVNNLPVEKVVSGTVTTAFVVDYMIWLFVGYVIKDAAKQDFPMPDDTNCYAIKEALKENYLFAQRYAMSAREISLNEGAFDDFPETWKTAVEAYEFSRDVLGVSDEG